MKQSKLAMDVLAGLWAVFCAGCGPGGLQPVPVSGQILIDGKPLANATIQVLPNNTRAAMGRSDEQGRFKLTTYKEGDGCVPGTHPVVVAAATEPQPDVLYLYTPEKYMDPKATDLSVTIEKATDDLKIELTWGGIKGPIVKRATDP